MTENLNLFFLFLDVNAQGVKPPNYTRFTDYIVSAGSGISEAIADTYDGIVTTGYRNLYLFLAVFVLLVAIVILVFFYFMSYISIVLFFVALVIAFVVFVLFYAVLDSFAREVNFTAAQNFGTAAAESVLLTSSSLFRDFLYLALLR